MAKYNITKIATDVESWERSFRAKWAEEAKAKNDRIIGDGYAERQIADTLSKVEPIDVNVSKIGHNRAPGLRCYVCSNCAAVTDTRSAYCPNCGASMRAKR